MRLTYQAMAFIVYIVVFIFVFYAIPAILLVLIYDLPWLQALLYGFFVAQAFL
jgi:hypothetical protein